MSSKTKANKRDDLHAIPSREAATGEALIANGARTEEIRRREYEIYLERGEQPGCDLDDCSRPNANSKARRVRLCRQARKRAGRRKARRGNCMSSKPESTGNTSHTPARRKRFPFRICSTNRRRTLTQTLGITAAGTGSIPSRLPS